MAYSVWSRGRLIGHTDLAFVYRENGFRCGWFQPNELGEKLMPAATGVAPTMRASRDAGRDVLRDPDVLSAFDYEQALELKVRGPNGNVIETEMIAIIDTHYLLSIPDHPIEDDFTQPLFSHDPEMFDPDEEEESLSWDDEPDEPWREDEDFPQYQIQVHLLDHDAIPY